MSNISGAATFDEFFPFDPGFGASANSSRWRKMAKLWQTDGVLSAWYNPSNTLVSAPNVLSATIAGSVVTVNPGGLYVHGYYAELQSAKTFTVGANGTIVAQVNMPTNNEFIQIGYRDGVTDYGSNPASTYEQDNTIWEMPLWLISSSQLIDLRTWINPGADLVWWNHYDPTMPINSGTTIPNSFLTARIPYAGWALLHGSALITFTDMSQAQSAACSLVYQYGVSGQQYISPAITPAITAGGVAGQQISLPVSLTAFAPVSQGRKTAGWIVTAGTGPLVQISAMTLSMTLAGVPPAA